MEDLSGLDRLDRWLNAQRGPRRLLLLWLDGMPLAVAVSIMLWGWLVVDNVAGADTSGLRAAVVVATILAVPFGLLLSGLQSLALRSPGKDPGQLYPRFSWRRSVFLALIELAPAYGFMYSASGQQLPRMPLLLSMLPVAAAAVMAFWETRYRKRAARNRLARAGLADG